MQAKGSDSEIIQNHIKHKDMIFVPNLDPNNCIFKEYNGILYLLAKNEDSKSDSNKPIISLRDVISNKTIPLESFSKDNIPDALKKSGYRLHDFEVNDKYLVFNAFVYLYVFQKDGYGYKYQKQINLKTTFDYLQLEDNKLKMLTGSVHGGRFEGEYCILNLEDESISKVSHLYEPTAYRFLYFQPKQVAYFFKDSYIQSEIIRPVIYFNNGKEIDSVNFGNEEWIEMPDSTLQKIDNMYPEKYDSSPKMVIDNLRKYLKQYSFVHKIFPQSDSKVLVIWSVPSKRKLYDYRYTIIQKNDNKYNIIADNMRDTPVNPEGSLSDFHNLMPFTTNIRASEKYLIDILPFPFRLKERHYTMSFLNLYNEINEYHLQSDETGFYINITELKND